MVSLIRLVRWAWSYWRGHADVAPAVSVAPPVAPIPSATAEAPLTQYADIFPPTNIGASPDSVSLAFAQRWLGERVEGGEACPCCTQFAKVYARTITSSMAYALICIYHHAASGGPEWFHVPSYLSRVARLGPTARGGDWAKLTAWGLLEEAEGRRDDNSPRTGVYRITDAGKAFVRGETSLPRWAVFYDGRVLRLDDSQVGTITDALAKRFNYAELMATAPSFV